MRRFTSSRTCWFVTVASILCLASPSAATSTHSPFRFGTHDVPFRSPAPAIEALRHATEALGRSGHTAPFAASEWTGCGVPLTPPVTNAMAFQLAFPDGSGGANVVWADGRNGDGDCFASRLDANGDFVAGWNAGGNPISLSDSNQIVVGTGTDNAGGLFAVFVNVDPQFDNQHDVYLQRLMGSGTPAAGYPAIGKQLVSGAIDGAGMLPDGSGGLFFGWAPAGGTLLIKRLDATGATTGGWPAGGIDTGVPEDAIGEPVLDGAGGVYFCWTTATTLNVQRFTATGPAAGWPAGGLVISNSPASGAVAPFAARLSSGDLLVAWSDPATGHVFAQRVTAAGAVHASWPAGGLEVGTGTTPQEVRDVLADGAGGALILWEQSSFVPLSFEVLVQRVTATAGISAGWPAAGVSLSSGTTAFGPSNLISDGADGALAAWTEIGGADADIYLQRVLANGTKPAGFTASGVQVCSAAGDQVFPVIVSDNAGGAILTWQDLVDSNHPQLRAGRVSSGGTVPALAALVDAVAEPGRVRLHWYTADGSVSRADVERSEGGGEFAVIGFVEADGHGHLRFEDRDVAPGMTYRYRLAVPDGAQTSHLGEVTVRVPADVSFRVAGFRPNPALGEVNVAFTLESDAPAELVVLDVAGRRVLAREVGDRGPGEHLLRLDAALPAGVYVVRLTQGGRSVVARSAIVR